MSRFRPPAAALLCGWLAGAFIAGVVAGPRPAVAGGATTLAVERNGAWITWWSSDRAPGRWTGPDSVLTDALAWRPVGPGIDWATTRVACAAPAWRAKLIVVRLDPRRLDLSLELDMTRDQYPNWTIDRAPRDALFAVNAGQFVGGMPWGWVVQDRRQLLGPGPGPLAAAIAIDRSGRTRWAHGNAPPPAPVESTTVGFQSYPALLVDDGVVPEPLRKPGLGVSHAHRDARLALGETRDGRLLVVLTRFDAMGEITGALPLGPTTPEMAAILGALGARDAMMLDGGISAQMLLREPGAAEPHRWPGMRKVPLALIARERGSGEK